MLLDPGSSDPGAEVAAAPGRDGGVRGQQIGSRAAPAFVHEQHFEGGGLFVVDPGVGVTTTMGALTCGEDRYARLG
jgi:hypothetical protein